MTIDEKIEHYSWSFSGQSSDQVITVMMAKQIIHEALKKQRIECAKMIPESARNSKSLGMSILNALEP